MGLVRLAWWILGGAVSISACGDDAIPATTQGHASGTDATPQTSTDTGDTLQSDTGTESPADEPGSSTGTSWGASNASSTSSSSTFGDSDPSTSSSTGEELPPVVEPSFIDVAAPAGLTHIHGEYITAPGCVIDQVGPGNGGFCLPERMSAAAAAGDFDGDGWVDLLVSRINGRPLLYHNRGDKTFEDVAVARGIALGKPSSGSILADLDNDGDLDLYITALGDTRYFLYINDGTGHFSEEAIARAASLKSPYAHAPMGVTVGDYDLDGYLDLYVAEWRTHLGLGKVPSHSRLLHNRGAEAPGYFEDVTDSAGVSIEDVWAEADTMAGVYGFAPAFGDLDGDGWPELTVVSDFRCSRLFWNNGDGTFTDGTVSSGAGQDRNGMGSAFGDYDRDGDLDWFVTAITQPDGSHENRLYRNEGNRHFTELAEELGVGAGGWGWGTNFFDPDNDGDLDLMMTNGYYYTAHLDESHQLWLNEGDGSFGPDIAESAGIYETTQGRGLAVFDYDRDGDLDVYAANNLSAPSLFENTTGNLHDWLRVKTVGTTSNRDGIGAKITVRVELNGPLQYHEVGSTSHYMGQNDRVAHFGVGWGHEQVAEVRVFWPASGQEQIFTDVEPNTTLVVVEP